MGAEVYDAVIVGSGAGGGAMAYALTRAGLRVVVLEKGPAYTEADFCHDELLMCRRDFFVPSPLSEPRTSTRAGETGRRRTSDGWISCCVGGGTVHMSGYFFRLRQEDMRLRSLYGEVPGASVADWPIEYGELMPYYEEVERVIGISGDATREPVPRGPYPLPPLLSHPSAALVEQGCQRLGLRAFPTPRAILSAPYAGRPGCAYCGFCGSYGCEVGAKSSTPVSLLALAERTGRLELRPWAMATSVQLDARDRASGVLYLDQHGAQHRVRAQVVVLACSAIETTRLLLLSASRHHDAGLGNTSGLVGQNLFFATLVTGWGRFPGSSPSFPAAQQSLPFLDRSVQDFYVAQRAGLPHPKAGTLLFALPHKNPILQAEKLARVPGQPPLFGMELKRKLREFFRETHTIEWEALSESLPHPGCSVALDPEVKDRFGLPVAHLRLSVHQASLRASDLLARKGREVLEAAGAQELGPAQSPPDGPGTASPAPVIEDRMYMVLQGGTARMGHDPRRSVLDPAGRVHDVKNLYVADASGFPSSGGAPFTLSIMANALRVAARIVSR